MKIRWHYAAGTAVLVALGGPVWAESSVDIGKVEFETSCASCHGVGGKGDGAVQPFLVKAPPDLTTLAKRNGGALPVELVWEMIDGRATTAGVHGTREMPVWGSSFRVRALSQPETAANPEWYVRGRIVALIDYLNRLQQK